MCGEVGQVDRVEELDTDRTAVGLADAVGAVDLDDVAGERVGERVVDGVDLRVERRQDCALREPLGVARDLGLSL